MKKYTFTINSFSKGFAMTGYRLGYVCAEKEHIKHITNIQSQITTSSNYLSQRCGEIVYNHTNHVFGYVDKLLSSMNLFYDGLIKIKGIHVTLPSGGIYLFPNISSFYGKKYIDKTINNSFDFCKYLLDDYKIGFLPGEIFGSPEHVRISYGINKNKINKTLDLLNKFIGKIKSS